MTKRWLATLLLLVGCRATPPSTSPSTGETLRVYVACGDGKIRVFGFDPASAVLRPIDAVSAGESTFLAFTRDQKFVYAVDEAWDHSVVRAFVVDPAGRLRLLEQVPSGGATPTYVSLDCHDGFVLVANYTAGSVSVFRRTSDGRLEGPVATQSFGEAAETHQIVLDPTEAFALVANKGLDAIAVFSFEGGKLSSRQVVPAGDGARHLVFHPTGKLVFVIDELASMISTFRYSAGTLEPLQSISTLPPDAHVSNTGAEIAVAPSGRFVYASNRGHDSIAIFAIDPQTGKLTLRRHVATQGKTPRHFSLDPTGRFLGVGNQESDSILIFRVDPETGDLTPAAPPLSVPSPAWVGLVSP